MLSRATSIWTSTILTALAAGLTACDVGRNPGTGVDNPVAQVVVLPDTLTLDPFANYQFRVFGRTQVGDSVPVTVRWTTSAGTITSAGTYTADTSAADAIVTATLTSAAINGSSSVKKRRVIQVVIDPKNTTVSAGGARQFATYGRRNTGDSVNVSVSYTATGGAISGTGAYTAGQAAGLYRVIARQNGGSLADTSAVTVEAVPVGSVSVTPAAPSLQVGQSVQLTATPRDAGGNPLSARVVTWASNAPAVATLNGSGLVTGVGAGSATITATSEGQNGTAAISVSVVPVASVSVSPAAPSVQVGQNVQLTATPRDAGGNALSGRVVTWATNNAAVATVNGSGLVTSAAAGSATITATSEGQNGTASISVSIVPVASVSVTPAAPSVQVGQSVQLTATPRDAGGNALSGRVVAWATNNAAVATVNGGGLVTGVAAGSATITATSEGQNGTAAISVSIVPVASVSVTPAAPSVQVGQSVQLTATPRDASGNPLSGRVVTWVSGAPAVASVNGSGLVTGVAAGTAAITATSEGQNGTASITVTTAVTNPGTVTNLAVASVTANSVTLSFTEVTNGAGQPASYDIRWAAGALSWASANEVTQGTCTVPVAGTAIGATHSCTVLGLASGTSYQFQLVAFRGTLNVDAVFGGFSNIASGTTTASTAPVATVTVSPASSSLLLGQSLQLTAILRDASGNTLTGRAVTWSSNLPLLASVNGSGLVSGLLAGLATITATSEGRSGSSAITVVVSSPSGEPVLNVGGGDAVIYQDNMDQYTTPHDMDSWPGYSLHPFYPDLYPNNYGVITSAHGAGGKALRLVYDKGNGDRFIWKTNPENISTWYAPGNSAFVLQYWFRISKNGGPGGGPGYGSTAVGMKWMELWNLGTGARTQFSVTAGNATTGPLWHVNPASRGPTGYQPVGPYWNQLNNNQWHRVTYLYQPASSAGATDGIARMWVDGTKIVDVSAAAAGITPPGGTKVWCTMAEVAQLDTYQTGMINLGEYMNGGLGDGVTDLPMALDFDDLMWWKLPVRLP